MRTARRKRIGAGVRYRLAPTGRWSTRSPKKEFQDRAKPITDDLLSSTEKVRERERGSGSFLGIQSFTLISRDIPDLSVLAPLQCADVGNNRPTILNRDLIAVGHHRIVTICNGVEYLAVCHLAIFVLMVVGNAKQSVFRGNPVTLSGSAVANCAIDLKFFLSALQEIHC